jgi:diaminohydroxyphosphoribosylaminopyrimidine deaminase / 5-amino-6-(5-phosphoribosylamino)uracil reductase
MSHTQDISYMRRALDLAVIGKGKVSPNPMVGCVIVHQNRIIGEGYHQRYGEAHAEVNAIQAVANKSLIADSTFYVSLEPCSHYGKTPPCADLLIKYKPQRVVICNIDVNPLVAGKGIQKLRNAGITVEVGLLEEEGKNLNKRFFTFITKQRPYLILKWAETSDGFIAKENSVNEQISNAISHSLVHKWRSEEDSIMVGTTTAHQDNPQLNVRNWTGRNPVRIVIDRELKLSKNLHLFDSQQLTLCYNLQKNEVIDNLEYIKLKGESFIYYLLQDLYFRKVQSVLIEGGTKLINSFLSQDYWDEIRLFRSKKTFGSGIEAPRPKGNVFDLTHFAEDTLWTYRR